MSHGEFGTRLGTRSEGGDGCEYSGVSASNRDVGVDSLGTPRAIWAIGGQRCVRNLRTRIRGRTSSSHDTNFRTQHAAGLADA